MRIVHIITRLLRAGADENTTLTCNGQAEAGHEVWLIHGHDYLDEAVERVDPRVKVLCADRLMHPVDLPNDWRALWQIRAMLRDIGPDVVHTHTSKAGIVGRAAARLLPAPRPQILHGVHILPFVNVSPGKARFYRGLEAAVAPFTDAYIAVSEGMRSENLAAGLGRDENNFVVASGMDIDTFRQADAPADLPPHDGLIVMVATLETRKRHHEFLPVMAEVVKEHPRALLALLGEGRERAALEAQARDLGIADNVLFLGFRDDAPSWIAASDLCVLPSEREGLPRVGVQYVAGGKPVVITALPGIEAIVRDGENGFVVPIDDVAAMKEPVLRLLSDPELKARMGAASRQINVDRWAAPQMVAEIETIMKQVAATRRAAA